MEFDYDVTLSFAGEDREYVDQVATVLKKNGAKVFYDKFEEIDLWGKDLAIHFDFVYRKNARYCIPFISKSYKEKIWTNHEIKTAFSRSITSNEEYILPARFDDTEIDGLRPTIGYFDLRKYKAIEFAEIVLKKLNADHKVPVVEQAQKEEGRVELYVGSIHSGSQFTAATVSVKITNVIKENRYFEEPSISINDSENKFYSMYFNEKVTPVKFPYKLEYGETVEVHYKLERKALKMLNDFSAKAKLVAYISTSLGEKYKSNEVDLLHLIANITAIRG